MIEREIPPRTPDISQIPTPPVPNRAETEMRRGQGASSEIRIPQTDELDLGETPHGPVQIGNFKPGESDPSESPLGNFEISQKKPQNGIEN
jgi:hypothetical protein